MLEIPKRRYVFSAFLVAAMLVTAAVASIMGYNLAVHSLQSETGIGAVAGVISLVVAPATTVIATLSTVLANLLQAEKT